MSGWNASDWYALLMGTVLKSMAVLVTAWLAATLARRRSAASRHLVWTAAFAALLALPFLSVSLPALRMPSGLLPSGVAFQATAITREPIVHAQPQVPAMAARISESWRPDWRMLAALLWAAGVAAGLVQILVAWIAMWRMRCRSRPFECPEVSELAEGLGIRNRVAVLEARRYGMPMTFGFFRPAVFMPADAGDWAPERRRAVLLHELAHVRRGDAATQLLARGTLSIYWWNPLAWAAWREFLKERERAADDLVLRAGSRASEYAEHLLDIARTMQSPRMSECVVAAIARKSQLEGRLLAILDSSRNRKTAGRAGALVAVLAAVSIVAPLAALRAQDNAPQAMPADVDATIRTAAAQHNYAMLDTAANVAERLLKYDIAQRLLESALTIRGEVAGQQSAEYGLGLLRLGDLERRSGKLSEAEASYAQAVSALGNRPEAAPALVHLGTNAMTKKNFDQALDYFQRAQAADLGKAGMALMWMAVVRQRQKNSDEAESLFKQALAAEDANSAEAATTKELYAEFLTQQGRTDEGKALRDEAAAVWKAQGAKAVSTRPGESAISFRVGSGVKAPQVRFKVDPEYTEEARLAKYQGTVVVSAVIGTDGLAYDMKAVRGLGLGLDEKAIEAIGRWKFYPGSRNDKPVPVKATIEVNFRLL